jgi:hypothetical protein
VPTDPPTGARGLTGIGAAGDKAGGLCVLQRVYVRGTVATLTMDTVRRMRKLVLIVAVLVVAVFAAGASAARGRPAAPPPFPALGNGWSHAEINVTIKGVVHTLVLDHGRVQQATPTQVTIREPDGTIHTIPLSPTTIYTWRGFGFQPQVLRRGLTVETMVIDQGAAVRVRVTLRA